MILLQLRESKEQVLCAPMPTIGSCARQSLCMKDLLASIRGICFCNIKYVNACCVMSERLIKQNIKKKNIKTLASLK